ncbi:MAG: ATP-grasp domain-containing protein [Pseudomonadota bacterium]
MTRGTALIVHPKPDGTVLNAILSVCERVIVMSPATDTAEPSGLEARVAHYPYRTSDDPVALACAIDREWPIAVAPPVWEGGVEPTAAICAALGLRGNPSAAAAAARDKHAAAICFERHGVPHPRTGAFSTSEEDRDRIERGFAYPFIVKSPWSTNSQSVTLVRTPEELRSCLAMLRRLYDPAERNRLSTLYADRDGDAPMLVQDYVEGIELNIDILFAGGDWVVLGAFEKHPMPGPTFEEVQSMYPPRLSAEALDRCARTAAEAVFALGGTIGAAHVELRVTDSGPVVIEVALRPGGFLTPLAIERLTGVHPVTALTRLLLTGELPTLPPPREGFACVYGAVNCALEGRIQSIGDERMVRATVPEIVAFDLLKRPGDRVVPLPLGTDYHVASFMLVGERRDALEVSAARIREQLQVVVTP